VKVERVFDIVQPRSLCRTLYCLTSSSMNVRKLLKV